MSLKPPLWPPTLAQLLQSQKASGPLAKRMKLILELLGPLPFTLVKVAGTNGKGSTCAMLEAALRAAGKRVGRFTSPHLVRVSERMCIDGEEISWEMLEHLARRWRALLPQFGQISPSFFELLLAMALDYFRDVDVVVVEAGIGGANDATHLLPAAVAGLTSVGMDHTDRLGDTLEEIAIDKAGICRRGETLVIAPEIACRNTILTKAQAQGVQIMEPSLPKPEGKHYQILGISVHLPLAGPHQARNLAVVAGILQTLAQKNGFLNAREAIAGVAQTHWPGRFERLKDPFPMILDVAHNPEALTALADTLIDQEVTPSLLVYGAARDKNLSACMAVLPRLAKRVVLVGGFYRAAPPQELFDLLPPDVIAAGSFPNASGAIYALKRQTQNGPILVTGSAFLVGAFKEVLG